MNRRRVFLFVGAGLILVLLGPASFFFGSKYALEHLSVVAVKPDALGQAMKGDHFFRSFRENTLLVSGKVIEIERKGTHSELTFADTHENQVRCSIMNLSVQPTLGSQVRVITEAARAVRLPHGVLLKNCLLL